VYLAGLPAPAPRTGAHVLPTPSLPAIPQLIAGMRYPFASVTGLPGIAGPVPGSESQGGHAGNEGTERFPVAAEATSPVAAPPLPAHAPLRASPRQSADYALEKRNCGRHRVEFCR